MSVNSVERPVGYPKEALYPQPDLSNAILFAGWNAKRGHITPIMPVAPFEDTVVLAIASLHGDTDHLTDEEYEAHSDWASEIDRKAQGHIGGIFLHPEFRLPWDGSRLGHYIGVIELKRLEFTHKRLIEIGIPKQHILWIDHHGRRVLEGIYG